MNAILCSAFISLVVPSGSEHREITSKEELLGLFERISDAPDMIDQRVLRKIEMVTVSVPRLLPFIEEIVSAEERPTIVLLCFHVLGRAELDQRQGTLVANFVVRKLQKMTPEKVPSVAKSGIRVLAVCKSDDANNFLGELLSGVKIEFALEAADALARIGTDGAMEVLRKFQASQKFADGGYDIRLRKAVEEALASRAKGAGALGGMLNCRIAEAVVDGGGSLVMGKTGLTIELPGGACLLVQSPLQMQVTAELLRMMASSDPRRC